MRTSRAVLTRKFCSPTVPCNPPWARATTSSPCGVRPLRLVRPRLMNLRRSAGAVVVVYNNSMSSLCSSSPPRVMTTSPLANNEPCEPSAATCPSTKSLARSTTPVDVSVSVAGPPNSKSAVAPRVRVNGPRPSSSTRSGVSVDKRAMFTRPRGDPVSTALSNVPSAAKRKSAISLRS